MPESTRRDFLKHVGQGTLAAGLAIGLPEAAWSASNTASESSAAGVTEEGKVAATTPAIFSKEFLSNSVNWEQPLSFQPVPPGQYDVVMDPRAKNSQSGTAGRGKRIESGVFPQPNGDLLFKIYAPNTQKVEVHLLAMEPRPKIVLAKQADGMHTGTFAYDPAFCGPMSTDIIFDGTILIYPYIPVFWHRDRPVNFIEIPDPETEYIQIRKGVPQGTFAREIFWSKTTGGWQRCMVYTPPSYQKGGEFPVLYLQAGSGENESTWEYNGRASHILDNLLAEGKCKPFIVVTCDGGAAYAEKGQGASGPISAFAEMLIDDVIPFIESKYHVKTGKWNRAMAGLSRGSHQTSSIGFTHPELFGYLGMFSGYMDHSKEGIAVVEDPKETALLKDAKRVGSEYKIVFRSMGAADHLLPRFLEDSQRFAASGLDKLANYHCQLYANQQHVWGAFRRGLYDFAQLIF